jgi:hypothetical protein
MCVCVKTFPKMYEFTLYEKKQLDFLDKTENQWKISQKSNLINY